MTRREMWGVALINIGQLCLLTALFYVMWALVLG